jgi:1,4-dihydroxy-2-naphthoyl-CoA hydrolase
MAIWFDKSPLDYARERAANSMIGHLGIEVIEAGDDYLKASMPVDHRTKQPAGVLHGGASVTLAETLASWGAAFCVDRSKHHCVGLEINANHIRPVSGGVVIGVAKPVHLGRTTHIWEIRISDERDKLVCISRITMAVLPTAMQY